MNELISIIIPIFNAEKNDLKRCINSLINQTYKQLEIILVDDGSLDECAMNCDSYIKIDCRIRVFHKKNGGVSSARNFGIEKARGKYIAFIDSDDYIEKNAYEDMTNMINKYDVDIVKLGYIKQYEKFSKLVINNIDKSFYFENNKNEIMNVFFDYQFGSVCTSLFKKDIIKDVRFDCSLKFGEDYYFYFQILQNSNSIHISNKAYYHYIYNDNSATIKFEKMKFMESFKNHYIVDLRVYEVVEKYKDKKLEEKALYCTYRITINLLKTISYNCNYVEYNEIIKYIRNQRYYVDFINVCNKKIYNKFNKIFYNNILFYYIKFKTIYRIKQVLKKIMRSK